LSDNSTPKKFFDLERSIIHLNVADFAVAVERVIDSRLKGRPVIIAPADVTRAVVYDMSEEAYRAGVRKAMALQKAVRLCRDACIRPPHPARYERAMEALVKRAMSYSPLIEPGDGDGHLFVDVTGTRRLFGPPVDIAWRLCKRIQTDLGFVPIWSVAPNKLTAKVATRLVKPVGEYVVRPGEEKTFLAPLPVYLIPGIERNDLLKLQEFNLIHAYQIAAWSLEQLAVPFGHRASLLYEAVRGIDPSPVLPAGKKHSKVIVDHEFDNDTNDTPTLESVLYGLVEKASQELRHRRLAVYRIGIFLDYSDGVRHVRHVAAKQATTDDRTIFELTRDGLSQARTRRVRIRHLRLTFEKLVYPPAQLELFPATRRDAEKRMNLMAVIDSIRERFGHNAIEMGRTLALTNHRRA